MNVPKEFLLLPPIVLDRISTEWVLGPGNDLLTHYTSPSSGGPSHPAPGRGRKGSLTRRCSYAHR